MRARAGARRMGRELWWRTVELAEALSKVRGRAPLVRTRAGICTSLCRARRRGIPTKAARRPPGIGTASARPPHVIAAATRAATRTGREQAPRIPLPPGVAGYGSGAYTVGNRLVATGHEDVRVRVWSGYRHEVHNEPPIRDEVAAEILGFATRVTGGAGA